MTSKTSVLEIVGGEIFSVLLVVGRQGGFGVADDTEHKQERGGAHPTRRDDVPDPRQRRVDDEVPGACDLVGDKTELALGHPQRSGVGGIFVGVNEFIQHHLGAGKKLKRGAVDKEDSDLAIDSSLDVVALINKLAHPGRGDSGTGTRDRERTDRGQDFTDWKRNRMLGLGGNGDLAARRIISAVIQACLPLVPSD